MRRAIVVTGGAGFIGSAVVRHVLATESETTVVNVDKLTYAANPATLEGLASPRHCFVHADICDGAAMRQLLAAHQPDAIVHLAAETHVDRSIDGPAEFIATNVVGTACLLDAAHGYWSGLDADRRTAFRFVHVSTDEVFGSLGSEGAFGAASPYRPRSPYAATKASGDHLVRAWHTTYGLPTLVTHGSNTYGPWQFPEKLVPRTVIRALAGKPIEVYGRGENVRDWLHVTDHAAGIVRALVAGVPGNSYLIGGGEERRNLDLVVTLCSMLDALAPRPGGAGYGDLISFVVDRPGHDFRYALDTTATEAALAWRPTISLEVGLRETIDWYVRNSAWWRRTDGHSRPVERLGLTGFGAAR